MCSSSGIFPPASISRQSKSSFFLMVANLSSLASSSSMAARIAWLISNILRRQFQGKTLILTSFCRLILLQSMRPKDKRPTNTRHSLPKIDSNIFAFKQRHSQQITPFKQQPDTQKSRLSHQISMKSTNNQFLLKIGSEQLSYLSHSKNKSNYRSLQTTQIKEQIFLKSKKSMLNMQSLRLPLINDIPKNKSQIKLFHSPKNQSASRYKFDFPEKGKNEHLFNSLHILLSKKHSATDYLKMLKTISNFTLEAKKAEIMELSAKYRLNLDEQSKNVFYNKKLKTIPYTTIANWNRVYVDAKTLVSKTTNFAREIKNIDRLQERANQSLEISFENNKQLLELSLIIKTDPSKTKKE